jgi:glycosyltransferase involved in cell wall biosynthesis
MATFKNKVSILLATYNGEKHLEKLLDSIVTQSCQNWKIIARDDHSADNTLNILKSFQKKRPNKIVIIEDDFGNLGVCGNFERLMEYAETDYIMFADQDDIWKPDKIEISLNKIIDVETKTPEIPIMIHTDLEIVGEKLNVISRSFWEFNQIDIQSENNLQKLFYRNVATGCTMIFNKIAKDISLPFPRELRVHDWWINMQVAAKGKVEHLTIQTVLYRQHQNNVIGAKRKTLSFTKLFTNLSIYHKRAFCQYKTVQTLYPKVNPFVFFIRLLIIEILGKIRQQNLKV